MPTLDDLRATLHERADLCDDSVLTGLVLADRARPVQRRRLLTPLLAAAAVIVAVAGAAGLGAVLHHDTGTPAAGPGAAPRPAPTWQFHIAEVPGWTVSYDFAMWTDARGSIPGAWGEAATLAPVDGQTTITYGYEPRAVADFPGNGMNVAIAAGRAVAVTVNGQPGWWTPGRTVDTGSLTPTVAADPWAAVKSSGDWQPALVWQNPDGSWNDLMGTVGYRPKTYSFDNAVARKAMMRIAKAVSLTTSGEPVSLPFSVDLAGGYRLDEVRSQSGAACGTWYVDPSTGGLTICRVTADQQRSEQLGLDGGADQIVGRRDLGDGTVLVAVLYDDARHHLVPAEVLASVDVTPKLADRSTWLPLGS